MQIEKNYQIPYELFKTAFTNFQKRYTYPRSYAIIAVLLVAFGIYAYNLKYVASENIPTHCLMMFVCLVLSGLQWYNPRKIRRNLLAGIKGIENDRYLCRIGEDCIEIGTISEANTQEQLQEQSKEDSLFVEDTTLALPDNFSGSRLYYTRDLEILEYDSYFLVYQKHAMFYVLPKEYFTAEEQKFIRSRANERAKLVSRVTKEKR